MVSYQNTLRQLMRSHQRLLGALLLLLVIVICRVPLSSAETAMQVPVPLIDEPLHKTSGSETAVLAGGCFWGVQAVFQHVKGVKRALSGYSGGTKETAEYETVSSGRTGHAESVEITFDPSVITYGTILRIYFAVAHDPTELNRQGPDVGTQYRSEIFAEGDEQKNIAEHYIAQLGKEGPFKHPIVTKVGKLAAFYPAEGYHQDYATLHPDNPYIAYNDLPKVESLRRLLPDLYEAKPVLVMAQTSK